MEKTIFCCRKSLLARAWVVGTHCLFAVYLVSLPLTLLWSALLATLCLLLAWRDYCSLPTKEFFLAYVPDGRWSYAKDYVTDHVAVVEWPHVQVKLAHQNPLLMVVDILDESGKQEHSLLVWRDSLDSDEWRLLRVLLNY